MNDFWMVWRDGHDTPKVKHEHRDQARGEAKRLARLHLGKKFFVLHAESVFEVEDPVNEIKLTRSWEANKIDFFRGTQF